MSRRVITDEIWAQIQNTLQFYGCYRSRNSKNIMKPFYGNFEQVRPGVIFLRIFVHGKQSTTVSILGRAKDYGRIFFKLRGILDKEWVFIDGSYIRAHQHASGARHGEDRAIGRSRGGATTKIRLAVDAHILKSLGVKSTIVKFQMN